MSSNLTVSATTAKNSATTGLVLCRQCMASPPAGITACRVTLGPGPGPAHIAGRGQKTPLRRRQPGDGGLSAGHGLRDRPLLVKRKPLYCSPQRPARWVYEEGVGALRAADAMLVMAG